MYQRQLQQILSLLPYQGKPKAPPPAALGTIANPAVPSLSWPSIAVLPTRCYTVGLRPYPDGGEKTEHFRSLAKLPGTGPSVAPWCSHSLHLYHIFDTLNRMMPQRRHMVLCSRSPHSPSYLSAQPAITILTSVSSFPSIHPFVLWTHSILFGLMEFASMGRL